MPIYALLDCIPTLEMPKFIGCLFAGAIARNVIEARGLEFHTAEVDAIEHMFLELYLALVLITIDITALAPVAGQMGVILLMQAILMVVFGIFVSFNLFGRDYGAAVMTNTMLASSLRELERDDLVDQVQFNKISPPMKYFPFCQRNGPAAGFLQNDKMGL